MTRRRLSRTLTGTFLFLGSVLFIAAAARFAYPLFAAGSAEHGLLLATYDYLKDMSLLIATGGVAYLSNVYQKRSNFLESLRAEWNEILRAKSAVFAFTHVDAPNHAQFVDTFCVVSETIDNMRVVYRNVGETDGNVGLYPYAPLHDMRRALQTLDPRKQGGVPATPDQRKLVRDAMLQAFYALRETFLEELDLDEPTYPLLISAARRAKHPGSTAAARAKVQRQAALRNGLPNANPAIDALLSQEYEREHAKTHGGPGPESTS